MTHPNEELVRSFFACFANGDMDTLTRILSDDLVHHEPGRSDLAGDYRGRDAVLAFFGRIGERTNGSLRIETVHDVLANDQRAVAVFTGAGDRDGETFRWQVAETYEIVDGRITDIRAFVYDTRPLDRVFGHEG